MVHSGQESWAEHRRRMLRETEKFIEYGLKHPEEIIEIPSKPVGNQGFPREVADWFWGLMLSEKADSVIEKWKHVLRSRPKMFRGTGRWLRDKVSR